MEKIVSFIPIKLNNQRLPDCRQCDYIFHTISKVEAITDRYVYCSDESIKGYLNYGLKFLKRDEYLDGFQVKGLEIIDHFVRDVDADIYVLTHVTQPFTKADSIAGALDKVLYEGYDSAFSCTQIQDYCWYDGKPLNYDRKDIVTTQNLQPVYMETGAFFIFRREVFTELHQRIGNHPYMCVIDAIEAIDIDTAEDFEFAKVAAQYQKRIGALT